MKQILYGGHQNKLNESMNIDKPLPACSMTSGKPFPPNKGQLKPSKIVEIWTFHMYLLEFMEIIVCKLDMSPKM